MAEGRQPSHYQKGQRENLNQHKYSTSTTIGEVKANLRQINDGTLWSTPSTNVEQQSHEGAIGFSSEQSAVPNTHAPTTQNPELSRTDSTLKNKNRGSPYVQPVQKSQHGTTSRTASPSATGTTLTKSPKVHNASRSKQGQVNTHRSDGAFTYEVSSKRDYTDPNQRTADLSTGSYQGSHPGRTVTSARQTARTLMEAHSNTEYTPTAELRKAVKPKSMSEHLNTAQPTNSSNFDHSSRINNKVSETSSSKKKSVSTANSGSNPSTNDTEATRMKVIKDGSKLEHFSRLQQKTFVHGSHSKTDSIVNPQRQDSSSTINFVNRSGETGNAASFNKLDTRESRQEQENMEVSTSDPGSKLDSIEERQTAKDSTEREVESGQSIPEHFNRPRLEEYSTTGVDIQMNTNVPDVKLQRTDSNSALYPLLNSDTKERVSHIGMVECKSTQEHFNVLESEETSTTDNESKMDTSGYERSQPHDCRWPSNVNVLHIEDIVHEKIISHLSNRQLKTILVENNVNCEDILCKEELVFEVKELCEQSKRQNQDEEISRNELSENFILFSHADDKSQHKSKKADEILAIFKKRGIKNDQDLENASDEILESILKDYKMTYKRKIPEEMNKLMSKTREQIKKKVICIYHQTKIKQTENKKFLDNAEKNLKKAFDTAEKTFKSMTNRIEKQPNNQENVVCKHMNKTETETKSAETHNPTSNDEHSDSTTDNDNDEQRHQEKKHEEDFGTKSNVSTQLHDGKQNAKDQMLTSSTNNEVKTKVAQTDSEMKDKSDDKTKNISSQTERDNENHENSQIYRCKTEQQDNSDPTNNNTSNKCETNAYNDYDKSKTPHQESPNVDESKLKSPQSHQTSGHKNSVSKKRSSTDNSKSMTTHEETTNPDKSKHESPQRNRASEHGGETAGHHLKVDVDQSNKTNQNNQRPNLENNQEKSKVDSLELLQTDSVMKNKPSDDEQSELKHANVEQTSQQRNAKGTNEGSKLQKTENLSNTTEIGGHENAEERLQQRGTRWSIHENITDIEDIVDEKIISKLNIRQLKEMLTKNNVNCKGMLSKEELVTEVKRLWKQIKYQYQDEDIQENELCILCHTSNISRVFECEHLVTCMQCGQQQKKCPTCEAEVVRTASTSRINMRDAIRFKIGFTKPWHERLQLHQTRWPRNVNIEKIEDIMSKEEILQINNHQLKEILMKNKIDCQDILEEENLDTVVNRLWKEHKRQNQDYEICMICRTSIINCVFIECGHFVACIECGQQIKECPICRLIVVHIVLIFR